jgi:hypothetical protein
LRDFKGANHGVFKNSSFTTTNSSSFAGIQLTTLPEHNETVVFWDNMSGNPKFDASAGTAPIYHKEIAHGYPGILFSGSEYLSADNDSSIRTFYATIHTDRSSAWPNDGSVFTILGYSSASESNNFVNFHIQDDGKIEVTSNSGGTSRTLTGTTVLDQKGTYHVAYSSGKIFINGADDSAVGSEPFLPFDITGIDTTTIGAIEKNNIYSDYLNECYIIEIQDFNRDLSDSEVVSVTIDTSGQYGITENIPGDHDDLEDAIDSIGNRIVDLYIGNAQTLTASVSTNSNTNIRVNGGSIDTNGYTLTSNGSFWSDENNVLICDGTQTSFWWSGGDQVVLSSCRFDRIRADWFTNATSDKQRLDWAIGCANASTIKYIYLDSDIYSHTDNTAGAKFLYPQEDYNNIIIEGKGRGLTTLQCNQSSSNSPHLFNIDNSTGVTVKNMTLNGNDKTNSYGFLDGTNRQGNLIIERVNVSGCHRKNRFSASGSSESLITDFWVDNSYLTASNNPSPFGMRGGPVRLMNVGCFDKGGGLSSHPTYGIEHDTLFYGTVHCQFERFCIWGMGYGSSKTNYSASSDGVSVNNIFINGSLRLCGTADYPVGYRVSDGAAAVNMYNYQYWKNVFCDGFVQFTPVGAGSSCASNGFTFVGENITIDHRYPALASGAPSNSNVHGFSTLELGGGSYMDGTVNINGLNVYNTYWNGILYGAVTDGIHSININNLDCSGCGRNGAGGHRAIRGMEKYGLLTVTNGLIRDPGRAGDELVDIEGDTTSDLTGVFINTKFSGPGVGDDAMTVAGNNSYVYAFDCSTEEIQGNVFAESSNGTAVAGSKPYSVYLTEDSIPGKHIFPTGVLLVDDGEIDLTSDPIWVALLMTNTSVSGESFGIRNLNDFATLDDYGVSARKRLTGQNFTSFEFSADDITWSSLTPGARNLEGALIYYSGGSSDSDCTGICWCQFNETYDVGIDTEGQDFKIEWSPLIFAFY